MGIDLYIGDNQVPLTNSFWYNEFLNWVAEMGEFPQILDRSPIHGSYELDPDQPASLYTGSVQKLKEELEKLKEMSPPEYASDIINSMLEGVNLSLLNDKEITMDDGAWEGVE